MDIGEIAYKFLMKRFEEQKIMKEGGALRAFSGETVEKFCDLIWELLNQKYTEHFSILIGKDSPIHIKSENGFVDISVDRHCYRNESLCLAIECKTYLDKCNLQRANSDFSLMKKNKMSFQKIIVSLENSLADHAYNFFLDGGNINKIFILAKGKRNSAEQKRIYNNFDRIQKEEIDKLVNYMEGFFNGNCYDT